MVTVKNSLALQQNYFLKEQNDSLRQKLNESKEYIKYLAERLKKLEIDT